VVTRAARQALEPKLNALQQENRELRQRVSQTGTTSVHDALDAKLPEWHEINRDPRFHQWLSLPDVYSGVIRNNLLRTAFQAADAPRVLTFFKGFLAEEAATGNAPAPQQNEPVTPPRVAAVPLENLAAPGKARPASGTPPSAPADVPSFTRAQVASFYDAVRKGAYNGREAEKIQYEKQIFAAQNAGRIR
jgi:hypothetical protein